MRFTIKAKLSLAACALVGVAIGAAALVQRAQIEADVRLVYAEEQQALADSLARDLNDKIDLHIDMLSQVAALAEPDQLASDGGRREFMQRVAGLAAWFDGVAIVGPDGEVLINAPELAPGTRVSVADRDYFLQALSAARPVVSVPLWSRSSSPAVILATPVRDKRQDRAHRDRDGWPLGRLRGPPRSGAVAGTGALP